MQLKNETPKGLSGEMKIIPYWAWTISVIAFISAQLCLDLAFSEQLNGPPLWARPLLGLLAGTVLGLYVLFIGYVNRDARRRGMSPVLWTFVSILIPNGLGIILYFILRQPLRRTCPQCGHAVQMGFNFCPSCSHKLSASCPNCQRLVGATDIYCPYCGTPLSNQSVPDLATARPLDSQ